MNGRTETNRLTADDYRAIDARITAELARVQAGPQWERGWRPHDHEWNREAWHALGCTQWDFRDVELGLIAQQVDHLLKYPRTLDLMLRERHARAAVAS